MSVNQRQEVATLLHGAMQGAAEDGLVESSGFAADDVTFAESSRMDGSSLGGGTWVGGRDIDVDAGMGLSLRRQRMLERHRANKVKRAEREARRSERRREAEEKDALVRKKVEIIGLEESVEFLMSDFERRRVAIERVDEAGAFSSDEEEDEDETYQGQGSSDEEEVEDQFGSLGSPGGRGALSNTMFDQMEVEGGPTPVCLHPVNFSQAFT
jgi:hypothetical protein